MCNRPLDIHDKAEAQAFEDATFDFLYPASIDTLHCRVGLCEGIGCSPSLFKCRYSENLVRISGLTAEDVQRARVQCAARNTCDIEPVGGEGGLIETPIRDDPLPQNIVERKSMRAAQLDRLQNVRLILVAAIVIFVFFI